LSLEKINHADIHFSEAFKQWKGNTSHNTPYVPLKIGTPWLLHTWFTTNRNRPHAASFYRKGKKDAL